MANQARSALAWRAWELSAAAKGNSAANTAQYVSRSLLVTGWSLGASIHKRRHLLRMNWTVRMASSIAAYCAAVAPILYSSVSTVASFPLVSRAWREMGEWSLALYATARPTHPSRGTSSGYSHASPSIRMGYRLSGFTGCSVRHNHVLGASTACVDAKRRSGPPSHTLRFPGANSIKTAEEPVGLPTWSRRETIPNRAQTGRNRLPCQHAHRALVGDFSEGSLSQI